MSKDGGPAFPITHEQVGMFVKPRDGESYAICGISKLDYFAAAALSGLTASAESLNGVIRVGQSTEHGGNKALAVMCYEFAAAMLAESERRTKE